MSKTPAAEPDPKVATSTCQPDPTSIFVLFEGPWIIDEAEAGTLSATTFDNLIVSAEEVEHNCAVGFGEVSGHLSNPIDGSKNALLLMAGQNCSIEATTAFRTERKRIAEIFDVPFQGSDCNDVFLYLHNEDGSLPVRPGSTPVRTVTFPTPDNVYVWQDHDRPGYGLARKHARRRSLEASGHHAIRDDHLRVHRSFRRNPGAEAWFGGSSFITAGPTSDLPDDGEEHSFGFDGDADGGCRRSYRAAACDALWSLIQPSDSSATLSFTTTDDTKFGIGCNSACFGFTELGLAPPIPHTNIATPADCGGGSLVLRKGAPAAGK